VNRKQRRAAARLKEASSSQPSGESATAAVVPANIADLLATGRKLLQARRLAEAEVHYRQVLAAQPNHADALNLLGIIAHQTGRHELAVESIRQAIQQNGRNAGYFSNLGNVLYGHGKLDEAIAAYRQAINLKPDYADAYFNLGAVLREQGKLDDAVAAQRQAIRIKSDLRRSS
jgi:tetratricopeptide (TPR) repeat protein